MRAGRVQSCSKTSAAQQQHCSRLHDASRHHTCAVACRVNLCPRPGALLREPAQDVRLPARVPPATGCAQSSSMLGAQWRSGPHMQPDPMCRAHPSNTPRPQQFCSLHSQHLTLCSPVWSFSLGKRVAAAAHRRVKALRRAVTQEALLSALWHPS